MQSSQLDTASPDQDGSRSQTAKTRQTFFIQQESMTVYPRCKFATVEQLQLSVLKRGKKVSALTNKKHCICPMEKTFRTFLRTEEETYFFNKWATIYMCYSKVQQNNLFEITQDSPTFLRHPVNPHRSILMLPLFARNSNLPGLKGQGESPKLIPSTHLKPEPAHG